MNPENIRGLLIDLDGVLYVGGKAIPGAREALEVLEERGIARRFVTNTTTRPAAELVAKLEGLGFAVAPEEIFSAVTATRQFLQAQGDGKPSVHLLVRDSVLSEFAGFPQDDEHPDFVVVGDIGAAWSYPLLNRAFRQVMDGATLIAMHRNKFFRGEEGLLLDIGAFVAGLEYVTGQAAHVVGKPSPEFFRLGIDSLGLASNKIAMIGDDIDTDVGGGQAVGLGGILVRTGKYRQAHVQASTVVPDAVLDSFADLPAWLKRERREKSAVFSGPSAKHQTGDPWVGRPGGTRSKRRRWKKRILKFVIGLGPSTKPDTGDPPPRRQRRTLSKRRRWKKRIRMVVINLLVVVVGLATLAALYTLISNVTSWPAQPDAGSDADDTRQKARRSETIEVSEDVRARLLASPEDEHGDPHGEEAAKVELDFLWRDADSREIGQATALFENYLQAEGDWREITRLIRSPEVTIPGMVRFYRGNARRLPAIARAEPLSILHVEWMGMKILRCEMRLVNEEPRVAFLVQEEENGDFQLDWESFEHYLPAPWQVFLKARPPGESAVRVIVQPSDDYAPPFTDRRRFDAFQLSRPREPGILFAYVERGSTAHDRLLKHFSTSESGTTNTMTLKIRYSDDALSSRQVVITEVVSPFWLVP